MPKLAAILMLVEAGLHLWQMGSKALAEAASDPTLTPEERAAARQALLDGETKMTQARTDALRQAGG
jgi:hypothetical protein